MKSPRRHNDPAKVEVTTISRHGIWLLSTGKELFIPFNEYPRFRDASVANIFHLEQPTPSRLHWPHLGMTVTLESLRCFPIASKPARSPRQVKSQSSNE